MSAHLVPLDSAHRLAAYDAARRALCEAHGIDEVAAIRDKWSAVKHYARLARDEDMLSWASEIKLRAERRAGELLRQMAASGERAAQGKPTKTSQDARLTLDELGLTYSQSSRWQQIALIPDEKFEEKIRATRREVASALRKTRSERQAEKRDARAAREAELAQRTRALPGQKFNVILADPEWTHEVWSETGKDRSAENHYPCSTTPALCARDVASLAADDAVLLLWRKATNVVEALQVMVAWGFLYKTEFIWSKPRAGTGYWNRNKHEVLMLGTRGKPPCPAMGDKKFDSVVDGPLGRHSSKPEIFLELIESYFPNVPKIELNRRGPLRPGWSAWGNEAEE